MCGLEHINIILRMHMFTNMCILGLLLQNIFIHCNMYLKSGLQTMSLIISTDKYKRDEGGRERWRKGKEKGRKEGREGSWNLLGKSFNRRAAKDDLMGRQRAIRPFALRAV